MLSVIVPVHNEVKNVVLLADKIREHVNADYEIIFVDDASSDGTGGKIKALAVRDSRIKYIYRDSKLGLSSAVVCGLCASKGDIVCVMDGDLQHDPAYIPSMLKRMSGNDLIIGSRFVKDLRNVQRIDSKIGTFLCRYLLGIYVKDPLSGFFMLRASTFIDLVKKINPIGYKILLELLFKGSFDSVKEVPIQFHYRNGGNSKLDLKTRIEFLTQLLLLAFFSKR